MITLGIETSCDETALCLLETRDNEYRILGNIVHSQIESHKEFGGVVPMLAKREHIKNLPILYEKILKEAGVSEKMIDRIAVTQGPGLEPALWTGILFAQELSKKISVPVAPMNHMEGHIVASLLLQSGSHKEFQPLKTAKFPALAVLISGGHTEIVKIEKLGSYEVLGSTVDDAIGEAFDKVARMLSLPYPGGPEISKLAETARKENVPKKITLPRPMIHSKDLKFSFSGLKTAVLYALREIGTPTPEQIMDVSREFEDAVTEVLISKTEHALEDYETHTLIIGGGVIANTHIREAFEKLAAKHGILLYLPAAGLSGDNALMIALCGSFPNTIKPSSEGFKASGNLSL
ncbi:MAG: tRNA N6-adenosine threonylcarbamoyltransferase [Patescibacteria group bacterium]|nr:tRNA N6-adenosine threonylcarbamoyltransferase [Patescibacteria group bacterium]